MKKNLFLTIIISLITISCDSNNPNKEKPNNKTETLTTYMIGKWETKKFLLKMPSNGGGTEDKVMKMDFDDPNDPVQKIKARSKYKENGTFEAWYVDTLGNEFQKTNGTWDIIGDTLKVEYEYLNKLITPSYLITKIPFGMKFYSIYDWDSDGVKDDTLFMQALKY